MIYIIIEHHRLKKYHKLPLEAAKQLIRVI